MPMTKAQRRGYKAFLRERRGQVRQFNKEDGDVSMFWRWLTKLTGREASVPWWRRILGKKEKAE